MSEQNNQGILAGEIALITGASRGIGRAIAHCLAEAGASVIGTATTESGAQAITQGFVDAGLKGRGVILNVGEQTSVDAALKDIEAHEGSPAFS